MAHVVYLKVSEKYNRWLELVVWKRMIFKIRIWKTNYSVLVFMLKNLKFNVQMWKRSNGLLSYSKSFVIVMPTCSFITDNAYTTIGKTSLRESIWEFSSIWSINASYTETAKGVQKMIWNIWIVSISTRQDSISRSPGRNMFKKIENCVFLAFFLVETVTLTTISDLFIHFNLGSSDIYGNSVCEQLCPWIFVC